MEVLINRRWCCMCTMAERTLCAFFWTRRRFIAPVPSMANVLMVRVSQWVRRPLGGADQLYFRDVEREWDSRWKRTRSDVTGNICTFYNVDGRGLGHGCQTYHNLTKLNNVRKLGTNSFKKWHIFAFCSRYAVYDLAPPSRLSILHTLMGLNEELQYFYMFRI